MVVPNYIPDPIEIPDNVTQQPYPVRLTFIRRMQGIQVIGVAVIAGLATLKQIPIVAPTTIFVVLLTLLIVLCLIRIGLRSTRREAALSSAFIPILLGVVTVAAKSLAQLGFPIWSILFGLGFAYIYTILCGRDFSFIAQLVLSLIASTVALAALSLAMGHRGAYAAEALGWNAIALTYFVYDGASLLSRRRVGEEFAAVIDLFRDVLNFFGYVPRVVHHWHKHRIWQLR
jgi:hypothetical protein